MISPQYCKIIGNNRSNTGRKFEYKLGLNELPKEEQHKDYWNYPYGLHFTTEENVVFHLYNGKQLAFVQLLSDAWVCKPRHCLDPKSQRTNKFNITRIIELSERLGRSRYLCKLS